MCVEAVAYEVCTGTLTSQTITQNCTEQLQCPTDPTGTDPGPVVEPPEGSELDCRVRNVYRPDLGEYVEHTVCMPAKQTQAHERLRAKQAASLGGNAE
jgi:hypothetical protein